MGGRAIVVGDNFQAIYRFRGADCRAFHRIREMLEGNSRPLKVCSLPVNYRSDQYIIEFAKQLVPNLQGFSKARGTVDCCTFGQAVERCNNDGRDIALFDGVDGAERNLTNCTFAFLCRINLPLIVTAYQLITQGKRVCIIGRNQIGLPLKNIIQDLCGKDESDKNYTNRISDLKDKNGRVIERGLMSRLADYLHSQASKFEEEKHENKLEQLYQNVECIEVIAGRVQDDKINSLLEEIDQLFTEEPLPGVISLSTIHRAKGLEWDVVFVLRPDLIPHPRAKSPEEVQQERNAEYVCYTRAKKRLYLVENWPFDGRGKGNKMLYYSPPQFPGAGFRDDPEQYIEEECEERKYEEIYEPSDRPKYFHKLPDSHESPERTRLGNKLKELHDEFISIKREEKEAELEAKRQLIDDGEPF